MTSRGNPSFGYTIDYSTPQGEIARWHHALMEDLVSTPLPPNLRLMYGEWDDDNDSLREFTRDQVRGMNLHANGIYYAKDFYERGLEDIPGGTLAESPATNSPSTQPATPSTYTGANWQDNRQASSVAATQEIQYNA